jgi:hypothetical protein
VTITAHPIDSPGPNVSNSLLAKAPASVLLVNDDRWYPVDGAYRSALAANGISFDVWRVPTDWAGPEPNTPSAQRLSWYPQVMWFTGYDWYQPLTVSNTQALQQYLQRGGRLLLSSQDFLADSRDSDFARQTLGVMDALQSLSAATASGQQRNCLKVCCTAVELFYQLRRCAGSAILDAAGTGWRSWLADRAGA